MDALESENDPATKGNAVELPKKYNKFEIRAENFRLNTRA